MFKKSRRTITMLCSLTATPMLLLTAGCPTVQPANVTSFQQSTDAVHAQVQTTFKAINAFVTEDEVDLVTKKKNLTEQDVAVMLSPNAIAKWEKAFSGIDSYCDALTKLLDATVASDFESSIVNAGTELQGFKAAPATLPDAVISTAFAQVGGILLEAKAQGDALKIAQKADPDMQIIFKGMAKAIGTDKSTPGIIADVWMHWNNRMAVKEDAFHKSYNDFNKAHPATDPANKPAEADKTTFYAGQRQIVLDYIQLRDQRDSQIGSLMSLRASLLNLAQAHSALARGNTPDAAAILTQLQSQLDSAKTLYKQFKALTPTTKPLTPATPTGAATGG